MKHKALSMLLALLMVVSLLPIAAIAGNEEVSVTAHEGKLEMRYNGSYGNGKYMPAGEHKVELRLWQGDENGTEYKLQEADKDYLHCGGAVKNVQYTATTQGEDGEESIPCWTIQLEGNEGDAGYIEYSAEGISMSRVMITLQAATGNDDKRVTEEDAVSTEPDNGPQVLFEDDNTTYYLGIAEGNSLFDSDGGCDLSNDTDFCSFALVAQVFTLVGGDYKPVSDEVREKLSVKYNFDLQIHATESCVDHYYPKLENDGVYRFTTKSLGDWIFEASATERNNNQSVTYKARLTIALKRTQAEGVLGMSDGGDFVKELEFSEGEHNVMLAVGTERLRSRDVISANNEPADSKLTYGGVVKTIEYVGGPWWRITLEDSEEADSKGWIQYGTDESNRVTITVKPSHGGAVDKNDPETKIYKQKSEEFKWASWGTAFPFKWHDETYYLGTAEWKPTINQMASPYAGQRGVNEDEAFYAACVFELKSGEAGNGNATYALREDIRKAMMKEGYQFELTLVPTDIGCDYYPIMETVKKTVIWDESSGENGRLTSKWQGQKFSKDSVGIWVYDARIIDPDGKQYQQNLSNCKYSYTTETKVWLDDGDVDSINRQIEDAIGDSSGQAGNGLYDGMVTFVLPSGEIEGQIVIPKTDYMISVFGNGLENGSITTTIKGGIRFDNDNTNHVGFIHFIGAGKDKMWANAEKTILNEAISGIGQGAPENCIFEEYDIAIHSSTRPSWGSRNSIYLNNNVAICQNSTNGGQPFMQNNWFVGNAIAVMLKEVFAVGSLRTFQNRFVNNGTDFCNETGKPYDSKTGSILWVSENFFYHDSSWQPQKSDLWSEKNGVIYLNYNKEGMLLVPNAPSFDETGDYKDDIEAYKAFLPRFGGWTPVYAYPLARSQFCDTFFYPNRRVPDFCPQWWPDSDPYYPSYVRQGSTISTSELDGSRFSSYDSETDTAVGTFDFGSSSTETEH